jgi:hypothetical protein
MKNAQYQLFRENELKLQDTTLLLKCPKVKELTMPRVGKDIEELELWYVAAAENVK